MFRKITSFFHKPLHLALLNLLLVGLAVLANAYYPAFCWPVLWATCLLIVCAMGVIVYPFFKEGIAGNLLAFINGIGFIVLIYCILFMADLNLWGVLLIPLLGLGLIVYVPHIFLLQLGWTYLIKPVTAVVRAAFVTGATLMLGTGLFMGFLFGEAMDNIDHNIDWNSGRQNVDYFTERIVGMHFLYHTQFCPYDGWRPPKHDPFLVIGLWFHQDPFRSISLKDRVALYHQLMPDRPVKASCACALKYQDAYHQDSLWQTYQP